MPTRDSSPELELRRILHGLGLRYRLHARLLPGTPDIVFPSAMVAVFVDGCFWHGCPKHATQPKGNASFWATKLAANKERDRKVNHALRAKGWKVLRIWEHDLRAFRHSHTLRRVMRALSPYPTTIA